MSDRITLTGLRARGHHGVYDFERAYGQDFVVDVILELDLRPPRPATMCATPCTTASWPSGWSPIEGEPVNLIETLADRLAGECLEITGAAATVTVHKPQAPIPHEFTDVAVTISRERR